MSFTATRWAWEQKAETSAQKLLLLALADRASDGERWECFPSIVSISEMTGLDRKTVMKAVIDLVGLGFISVKNKNGARNIYVLNNESRPENGTAAVPELALVPKTEPVPILDTTSPKNGTATSPKNGTRTYQEPINNLSLSNQEKDKREKRGTSFALTAIPDEWIKAADNIDPKLNAVLYFEVFADYWRGVPGEKGRKKDWLATWRNSIRDIPGYKRSRYLKNNNEGTSTEAFMQDGYWENESNQMI